MQISTIGLDLAKTVFQVRRHRREREGHRQKQLRRSQVIAFFKALPPCLVGMKAVPRRIIGHVSCESWVMRFG